MLRRYVGLDCYDQTDAVSEKAALSADVDVEPQFTQTDSPELVPSYADFLIAYPTQSCKLNADDWLYEFSYQSVLQLYGYVANFMYL